MNSNNDSTASIRIGRSKSRTASLKPDMKAAKIPITNTPNTPRLQMSMNIVTTGRICILIVTSHPFSISRKVPFAIGRKEFLTYSAGFLYTEKESSFTDPTRTFSPERSVISLKRLDNTTEEWVNNISHLSSTKYA